MTHLPKIYASLRVLTDKTHAYHIRTLGKCYNLHLLTGDEYEALEDFVDTVGEKCETEGEKIPVSYKDILANSSIMDGMYSEDDEEMAKELRDDSKMLAEQMKRDGLITMSQGIATIIGDLENHFGKAYLKYCSILEEEEESNGMEEEYKPTLKKLTIR